MVLSMTGFGRAEGMYQGRKISVELKSLNSKTLDLNMKVASRYREKEFELRKLLQEHAVRGKLDCYINVEATEDVQEVKINQPLVKAYMQELKSLASDGPMFEYLKMAVRMPEVLSSKGQDLEAEEWNVLQQLAGEALQRLEDFRREEGSNLSKEIALNIEHIAQSLSKVDPYESQRIEMMKEKYQATLQEFENVDQTRFFQELAYYTEKLDISEEKVRLSQHLKYYLEVMQLEEHSGKKLGFIAQEIGREINTLGSKANHSEIQKLVVEMKDELEKIKEQTLNIL